MRNLIYVILLALMAATAAKAQLSPEHHIPQRMEPDSLRPYQITLGPPLSPVLDITEQGQNPTYTKEQMIKIIAEYCSKNNSEATGKGHLKSRDLTVIGIVSIAFRSYEERKNQVKLIQPLQPPRQSWRNASESK